MGPLEHKRGTGILFWKGSHSGENREIKERGAKARRPLLRDNGWGSLRPRRPSGSKPDTSLVRGGGWGGGGWRGAVSSEQRRRSSLRGPRREAQTQSTKHPGGTCSALSDDCLQLIASSTGLRTELRGSG